MAILRLAEPVALSVGLQDVDTVRQAIEQRSGQPFIAHHVGPGLKRQVRGHDQACPLVGPADHLEQQFGTRLAEGHVAQFVQHDQVLVLQLLAEPFHLPLFPLFQQSRHQAGCREEQHPSALVAGRWPDGSFQFHCCRSAARSPDDRFSRPGSTAEPAGG